MVTNLLNMKLQQLSRGRFLKLINMYNTDGVQTLPVQEASYEIWTGSK